MMISSSLGVIKKGKSRDFLILFPFYQYIVRVEGTPFKGGDRITFDRGNGNRGMWRK
jgi:hypothetical protein